jgi:hypothetical protein
LALHGVGDSAGNICAGSFCRSSDGCYFGLRGGNFTAGLPIEAHTYLNFKFAAAYARINNKYDERDNQDRNDGADSFQKISF